MIMVLSKHHDQFLAEMQEELMSDYKQFNEYQEKALLTLQIFHDICEKYNITYYLAYGSLLGAIRDGGQIPWDYDIDVQVPYTQAVILLDALDKELPEGYSYLTRLTNKTYRTYTLKIAPSGFDPEVLHVDVFWMHGLPESEFSKTRAKVMKYNINVFAYKFLAEKYFMLSKKSEMVIYRLCKFLSRFFSVHYIDKYLTELLNRAWTEYDTFSDSSCENLFKKKWFLNRIKIKFENGMEFYAPQEYDAVLKSIYGDYLSFPSLIGRRNEFYKTLNRLNAIGRK